MQPLSPAAPQPHERDLPHGLPLTLKSLPFFSTLGPEVLREVLAGVAQRTFLPGEVIVHEGAPGRSMFLITQGQVSVVRQDEDGAPLVMATLGEGQLFGELALLCEGPRLSNVVATQPTVLLEFFREHLEHVARRHPRLEEALYQLYHERLLANVLRSNPLFAGWPESLRRTVSLSFTPVAFKAGAEIISQGQPGHALYLVLRGRCSAFHRHPQGHETPYPAMSEGDVFGEISLLRNQPATASVRATSACLLLKLERSVLDTLLPHHPMLRKELQRLSAERMLRTTMLVCGRPIHLGDSRV